MGAVDAAHPPDPASASRPTEFIEALHALRRWAGQPSLRQMRRLGGTTTDNAGREIDALPEATTSYVLRGDRTPRAGFVRAFVTACLATRRRRPDEIRAQVERWHQAWLNITSDHPPGSAVSRPDSLPVPRQLPPDVPGFTGRRRLLATLDTLLATDGAGRQRSRVATLEGMAGVGKTAVALHWAHRVRDRFPDGQLYVDLCGYADDPPLPPPRVLGWFLAALGVPADRIPTEPHLAAATYRSLLADTRTLVILDNAASAEQVRPLLPAGDQCVVLVTSRERLTGLAARDGARRLAVDLLPPDEARALLEGLLDPATTGADTTSLAELCRLCGHLPLALRVAAANITAEPQRRVADYLTRIRHRDRLGALAVPGDASAAVTGTFDLSYDRLPDAARRAFRLLGLVPGPDVTVEAVAALTGIRLEEAEAALQTLCVTHLVEQPVAGRYALHDLLRAYAANRAQREEWDSTRRRAVAGLYTHYLRRTAAATALLYPQALRLPDPTAAVLAGAPDDHDMTAVAAPDTGPGFDDRDTALRWLDAERANLFAGVVRAAQHGAPEAWRLADLLRSFVNQRALVVEGTAMASAALAAAEAAGDRHGQAAMLLNLAGVHDRQGQHRAAVRYARQALSLCRQVGWVDGEGAASRIAGVCLWQLGRLEQAIVHHRLAFARYQHTGWVHGQAAAANSLGVVHLDLGDLRSARTFTGRALGLNRALGSTYGEAANLATLGEIHRYLGDLNDARDCFTRAHRCFRAVGDRGGMGNALRGLAAVHRDAGRPAEASALIQVAVASARRARSRRLEADALITLGGIELLTGRESAADSFEHAIVLTREGGNRFLEAAALIGLAFALQRRGSLVAARRDARAALALTRRAGYRLLEGQATTVLASVHLRAGDAVACRAQAERALAIHHQTGHRPGQVYAHVLLGEALRRAGAPGEARRHLRLARGIQATTRLPRPPVTTVPRAREAMHRVPAAPEGPPEWPHEHRPDGQRARR